MRIARRRWLAAALLALAPASAARAQSPSRLPRIGMVAARRDEAELRGIEPIRQLIEGLREQGLVEGRDYAFELRFTAGRPELFEPLTRELVAAKVDILLPNVCGVALDAARRATQTIPIVVSTCNDDLVDLGVIESLKRPGGNITGLSKLTPELAPKRLQLLLQAVPKARRIAVLWNPAYAGFEADWRELRGGADRLGVTLHAAEFRRPDDLEPAFDAMARSSSDAMTMFSDQLGYVFAPRVAKLALERRLPGVFAFREVPDAGGLMSYGPSIPGMYRQSARLIARVLQGEKPGELPIEQASRFELAINLKTARQLGVTVPQDLLLRADVVIE